MIESTCKSACARDAAPTHRLRQKQNRPERAGSTHGRPRRPHRHPFAGLPDCTRSASRRRNISARDGMPRVGRYAQRLCNTSLQCDRRPRGDWRLRGAKNNGGEKNYDRRTAISFGLSRSTSMYTLSISPTAEGGAALTDATLYGSALDPISRPSVSPSPCKG